MPDSGADAIGAIGVEGVELVMVRMQLAEPWRSPLGDIDHRDVLLVRAVTTAGEGWAECVAMAEPTYTSEYGSAALHVLCHQLIPRLLSARGDVEALAGISARLGAVKGHQMARSALYTAVIDGYLHGTGQSFAGYLAGLSRLRGPDGGPVSTASVVPAGVAVGITESVPDLVDAVGRRIAEGYRRIKLKVQPGFDVEPLAAVRDRFGDGVALQVDANGSYQGEPVEAIERLDQFGLLLIEQPLGDDDLVGHARLGRIISTPVCLDEAITSIGSAESALALGACQVVNIKAARVGGYAEAVSIHDLCAEAGVPVWCGGMLETGIGRAPNLALASLPNFTLVGDLSASARYWSQDLTPPFELDRTGYMEVPTGAGIGVEINADLIGDAFWREWFRAPG